MKLIFKIALIITLGFQISCGSDSQKRSESAQDSLADGVKSLSKGVSSFSVDVDDYSGLINELDKLEESISLNHVLQKNSDRSSSQILAAISNARSGALIIAKYGADDKEKVKLAFDVLTTSIGLYDAYGILEFEQSRFDKIFKTVKALRALTALNLGVSDSYTWVLYNHNFADGIEPYFNMFAGKDQYGGLLKWVTNFQTDVSKAKIQGRSSYSWMVSKPFSFKGVKDPTFTYFTQFTVVAPNPKDSLNDIVNKVFQTYIILDLLPGESPEKLDDSRKIKINYDIDDLPLARNFHDAWMPKISLNPYKGHKVSIAFLFDTREIEETQYYIWDIFDVEIRGSGVLKDPASVYAPNFDENLGGFKTLSLNFGGEKWNKAGRGLSVKSSGADTDTFLLSPQYYIDEGTESFRFILTETLKGADLGTADLVVSTNYKGGIDPSDESIIWETIASNKEGFEKRQSVYDLGKYKGETIVFGFRFKSKAGKDFSWTIDKMYLETEGENLTEIDYSVPDLDQRFMLASYDLVKQGRVNFKTIYEGDTSPKWTKKAEYYSISGYVKGGAPKLGGARVLFKEVDLLNATNAKVRITHAMKHLNKTESLKVQIRISCADIDECVNNWEDLIFAEGTFAKFVDDLTTSSWLDLADKYKDQKVEFSLYYKAGGGSTPEWMFKSLEVGGLK